MRITEKRSFTIAPYIERPIECKFMNRAGSWDSIQLTKYQTESLDTGPVWFDASDYQRVAGISSVKEIQYFTQWYGKEYFEYLKDLVHSPEVYIDGEFVKLKGMTYEYDSINYLYSFILTVSPKHEENFVRL